MAEEIEGDNSMEQVMLEQIDAYIKENYWDWKELCRGAKFSYSIEKQPESWSQKLRKKLDSLLGNMEDTFAQRLWKLIDARGMSDVEVYKKANLDRRLFSKIRNEKSYKPGKGTAIALGIALELNKDEFEDLLKRAGFALSSGNKEDVIVKYFIEHKIYNVSVINEALVHYGFPILGERKR